MSKGIKLSEQHGVNPSLLTCFFCGEPIGVALLGRLPGDAEAPREMCEGYDPCDKCKEKMAQGITLIEANSHPIDRRPPIQAAHDGTPDLYPTGRWLVLEEEALDDLIGNAGMREAVREKRSAYVDKEVVDFLTEGLPKEGEGKEA